MERKRLCQSVVWLAVGVSAAWLANSAAAQETLGRNKSSGANFRFRLRRLSQVAARPRQVRGRAFWGRGLPARALHVEQGVGRGACELSESGRTADPRRAKRAAKGDQPKPDEQKKAGAKPAEAKGPDRKPDGATGDAKPSDGSPADIMAPERRRSNRPNPPAAGEAKPAEGAGE